MVIPPVLCFCCHFFWQWNFLLTPGSHWVDASKYTLSLSSRVWLFNATSMLWMSLVLSVSSSCSSSAFVSSIVGSSRTAGPQGMPVIDFSSAMSYQFFSHFLHLCRTDVSLVWTVYNLFIRSTKLQTERRHIRDFRGKEWKVAIP